MAFLPGPRDVTHRKLCLKNPPPDCFATQQAVESKAFMGGFVTILF